MKRKVPTQVEMVKGHLEEFGSITDLEAYKEYGIRRLSDVIFRLRKSMIISTVMVHEKNRFGIPIKFGKYVLEEGMKNEY